MTITELEKVMKDNYEEERALGNEKYMKYTSKSLGMEAPLRKKISKPFIDTYKDKSIEEIMEAYNKLSNLGYRDYLFVGTDLLKKNVKKIRYSDILEMVRIATTINPWWDSTDTAILVIRRWFAIESNYKYLDRYTKYTINDKNFWVVRMGIISQLCRHDTVNLDIIDYIIPRVYKSTEFFVQKALGWILRDISTSYPEYIRKVISSYDLKPVTLREAKKYI